MSFYRYKKAEARGDLMANEHAEFEVIVQVRTTVSRLVEARHPVDAIEKVTALLDEEGYEAITYSVERKERP